MNPSNLAYWPADKSEPVHESTVGSILRDAAAQAPDQTAVVAWGIVPGQRRTWTYAELLHDAERTARALLSRFEPGEHIAIWAPNLAEWLLLELGAGLAGVVVVTVNPAYKARELEYVLRQSRAVGLFHIASFRANPMAEFIDQVRPALPNLRETIALEHWDEFLALATTARPLPAVGASDPAQIQYTSGTTGSPKGALLPHRALTNNARLFAQLVGMQAGDVYGHAMPFFHTAGCVLAGLGAIAARAAHAFIPAFEPARLLALIEQERVTHTLGVPTMLIAMLEQPQLADCNLDALRVVASGGASVPPELVRSIESRFGASFCTVYGQTETSPLITTVRLDDAPDDKAETVGKPLPQTEVKIIDPALREIVAHDTVGELCTRGYLLMTGYFDNAKATAATIDTDGWLHTGDLATMDARGYVRITGRLKDMVIRGGENMFPAEIESVLIEHPDVVEVAIIGVPDPKMGEELAAFVRTGVTRPEVGALHDHVRKHLAAPKTPRYWIFIDAFPLTGSGKIQKFILRERYLAGEYAAQALEVA